MEPTGTNWSDLIQFEPVLSKWSIGFILIFFPIWTNLNQFDPTWFNLIWFDPIWTNFIWFEFSKVRNINKHDKWLGCLSLKKVMCFIEISAAKSKMFFQVQPNLRVQTVQVGPQDPKTGPIGSDWPQIEFKFGFNPIMLVSQGPKLGWVGLGWPSGSKFGSNFGRVGWVHLI